MTVTDSAAAGHDSKNFIWTVNAAPTGVTPIKDIQGTGDQLADRRPGRATPRAS